MKNHDWLSRHTDASLNPEGHDGNAPIPAGKDLDRGEYLLLQSWTKSAELTFPSRCHRDKLAPMYSSWFSDFSIEHCK